MANDESKILSCLFLLDVLCFFVKSKKFTGVLDRCMKCNHYFRFMADMEDEEEQFFEELEKLRVGESYGR